MINYKVANLDSKTTKEQRAKLTRTLEAVGGIEKVSLNPEKGELSLTYKEKNTPEKSAIEKAVSSSGFTLGDVRN